MSKRSPVHLVITALEAERKYRLGRRHITRLAGLKKIVGRKAGETWLIDTASLRKYLATPRKRGRPTKKAPRG